MKAIPATVREIIQRQKEDAIRSLKAVDSHIAIAEADLAKHRQHRENIAAQLQELEQFLESDA